MENGIIIALATLGAGLVGLIIRYSYRSKCEDVNFCWGFLKFHRDVRSEKDIVSQESIQNEEET